MKFKDAKKNFDSEMLHEIANTVVEIANEENIPLSVEVKGKTLEIDSEGATIEQKKRVSEIVRGCYAFFNGQTNRLPFSSATVEHRYISSSNHPNFQNTKKAMTEEEFVRICLSVERMNFWQRIRLLASINRRIKANGFRIV